ncbi:MAG TPA: DUF2213 domain-containing protein [Spirochaetota bacterium]|nr:DUF2213 domain-containing protein [Spirochaetota bacterium]
MIKKLLNRFIPAARARNDAGERIESMRFSVPALRVGVLEYGAGQLQTGNAALDGKPVKLYYPPEAVSDEKFLKSLETAPVVVGGHDSTTNEQNKKIDGWAHNVFFDGAAKAAMIAGVVKGAKEVAYIKGNLGSAGFGASAFVDIYNLKVENGITPDGQEYNAIANDLRATHVALAPHVRDPENKIKVINAVCVNTDGTVIEDVKNSHERGEKFNKEVQSMEPKEIAALVKNAVEEAIAAKNGEDRMDAMEEVLKKHGDALNEISEKLTPKKEEESVENAEDEEEKKEEEKEAATLENAKPSQEMVKVFSTALNVDFGAKTPTFATLATLAGIKETDPAARIAAVNTKFAELQAAAPEDKDKAVAKNAAGEVF